MGSVSTRKAALLSIGYRCINRSSYWSDVQAADLPGDEVDVVHKAVGALPEVDGGLRPGRLEQEFHVGRVVDVDRVDLAPREVGEDEVAPEGGRVRVAGVDHPAPGDRLHLEPRVTVVVGEGAEGRRDVDGAGRDRVVEGGRRGQAAVARR